MQDRKEYILDKAFEAFMTNGYDSVSMTVLQKAIKMSRGAMYRYFDSKDALFIAVIDKYVFGMLDYFRMEFEESITITERIEQTYKHLTRIGIFFNEIEGLEIKFLNYTALIIQAAKHYPSFLDKMKKYKSRELNEWELIIQNSIEKGEIRKDTDVKLMAQIFTGAVSFKESDSNFSFCQSADFVYKMMNYMYSLIKT